MRLAADFEIIQVAGEWMAVPVGDRASAFHGIIALSEPAAFLLQHMKQHKTIDELAALIHTEYDVDALTAEADVKRLIPELIGMGLIEE